jgi:hypothetical protein
MMKAGQRGLTTVEVLVAAGIVSIGIVALLSLAPLATYGLHEGSHLSTATFLAEQKLEELRGARWSAVPAVDCLGLSGTDDIGPMSSACNRLRPVACRPEAVCDVTPDEPSVAGHPGYGRHVRIAECNAVAGGCGGVASPALRQVVVTVTYQPLTGTGRTGAPKPVILVMNVARR